MSALKESVLSKREVIFQSPTQAVTVFKANEGSPSSACAVLFSCVGTRELVDEVGGTVPLLRAGVDVVSISSNSDDWHQGLPQQLLDNLAEYVRGTYPVRYGYGSSMGGYAAMLFAEKFGLHRVFAMSPQYTIQDEFDGRWRHLAQRIDWQYDINGTAAQYAGEIFVTYDPHNLDAQHFNLIQQNFLQAKVIGVPIKFGSHPTTFYFRDSGYLKEILTRTLIEGAFPEIRFDNHKNMTFHTALAWNLSRNPAKLRSALVVAKRAEKLDSRDHGILRLISGLYSRTGDPENALSYIQRAIETVSKKRTVPQEYQNHLQKMLAITAGQAAASNPPCGTVDGKS